jgi:hypothetical protein
MIRRCAIAYLEMLARDIANGAKIWDTAQTIERRFRLQGYTVAKVMQLDEARAKEVRRLEHEALKRSPDNWWYRMSTDTHSALCREFGWV